MSMKLDQMMTWAGQINTGSETSPSKEISKEYLEFPPLDMISPSQLDKVWLIPTYFLHYIELCRRDYSSRAIVP